MLKMLGWGIAVIVALAAAVLVAARLGTFAGREPADLGVRDGKLKPPSPSRNSVSSQAGLYPDHPMREYATIAPLPLRGDGPATIAALRRVIEAMDGAQVVEARDDYLRATFRTRWMGFVDDVELWSDPTARVVQVRSASRVGRGDMGVNRARVEAIRRRLAAL